MTRECVEAAACAQRDILRTLQSEGHLSPDSARRALALISEGAGDGGTRACCAETVLCNRRGLAAATAQLARLLSFANFIKVFAVAVLLFALSGLITLVAKKVVSWLTRVPQEAYQAVLLAICMLGCVHPAMFWASQASYILIGCALAMHLVLGWIVDSHAAISGVLEHASEAGWPVGSLSAALATLFCAALAVLHNVSVLAFASAVAFSGVLGFSLVYTPGTLYLCIEELRLAAVTFGHLPPLALLVLLQATRAAPYLTRIFFPSTYYFTIASGCGFLIGASPWMTERPWADKKPERRIWASLDTAEAYLALFLLTWGLAMCAYFVLSVKVVGTILTVYAVLLLLEWTAYLSSWAGYVPAMIVTGASLYGVALAMEQWGSYLVWDH